MQKRKLEALLLRTPEAVKIIKSAAARNKAWRS